MPLYDLNTAKRRVSDYATQRYGRGPQNDQEWGEIGQGIDLNNIDDDALTRAYGNADRLAQRLGASPSPPDDVVMREVPTPGGVPIDPGGHGGGGAVPPSGAVPPNGGSGGNTGPNVPPNLQDLVPGLFQQRQPSPWELQAQEALQMLLRRGQTPPSLDDPMLSAASDAYRSRQQRGADRLRNAAAERAAASGTLTSGGFDTEALGYLQDANTASANYDAQLMLDETQARRQELQSAIQIANQMGQFDQAQQLQQQLALLEASLQRYGIDQDMGMRGQALNLQRLLGTGDLDLRNRGLTLQGQLGRGDLGLRLMQSLLQNDQFYSQLGLSAAQIQALLNQNGLMQLLGAF